MGSLLRNIYLKINFQKVIGLIGQGSFSNVYRIKVADHHYVLIVVQDDVSNILKEIRILIKLKSTVKYRI